MITQLEDLIGQRLVIGFPGKKVTPAIIRHFKELHATGVIFYRINFDSPEQIKKVIQDLENELEKKLLVTVDHEGGRVTMFRDGVTIFPDNLSIGTTGDLELARKQGEIEAKELRRLGVDVNLSPVLDVLTDSFSPNIGIRSYGKDWKLVSEMGAARITAMQKGGVSACAKHFPGKGHAPVDAHLSLPTISSTWKEMEGIHLKPFIKAIEIGTDFIMSSHPYYPNLDPDPNNIATFSKIIVKDTLRDRLGYKGVIASDDLEMGAVTATCPIDEAAIKATESGHDLLLVCHDLNLEKKVYYALLEAYKSKRLPLNELEKSVERIQLVQKNRQKRFEGGTPRLEKDGKLVIQSITDRSVTVLKNKIPSNIKELAKKRFNVIFPKISSFDKKIMVEKEILNEKKFLGLIFKPLKLKPKIQLVDIDPSFSKIRKVTEGSIKSDLTVLFCWDAHLFKSNKDLLESVQKVAKNLVAVLLRDPYDVAFVQEGVTCITDFGWRNCQISACLRKLFS